MPQGKVYDKPVISLGVVATAIEISGQKKPQELDGVNLIPYLCDQVKGEAHEALYWCFWEQSAVRMGAWKLLKAGKQECLFNLDSKEHE